MKIPNLTTLKNSGNLPRVHGNGFIQLDLPDGSRLHVWDEDVPRQKVSSSIHDHAFGFKSSVIAGVLTNVEYKILHNLGGYYRIYTPVREEGTEDTKLAPSNLRCNIFPWLSKSYRKGETYEMEPLVFHDSLHQGTTATIMTKTYRAHVEPRVLVPFDEEPDNDFNRDEHDVDLLWSIVSKALKEARKKWNEQNGLD